MALKSKKLKRRFAGRPPSSFKWWRTDRSWDQRWMVEHPRFKDEKVTMVVKIIMASWFAQMSDFGLFCWWNDWRPEMHHTSSSLSKTVTHVHWWTPLFSWRRRASCFLARFLTGTFLSGSLNWACFPLLSNSSPLLSAFLSGPLNWALFWAKLLNWALFWANLLVWALFWALKKAYLLLRARFWVVLLFWALKKALKRVKPLKIALKKALKLRHNLPRIIIWVTRFATK